MLIWICAGAVLLSSVICNASPRVVVVAVGKCEDSELVSNFRQFSSALQSRLGPELLEQQQLLEKLPAHSKQTTEELERQLEALRIQFYQADNSKSEHQLQLALAEIERLPPGEPRRRLWVDAKLLHAHILRALGRSSEADDAFRRVLRLDPNHVLNPDFFSPLAQSRFERIRRDLAKVPKVTVTVSSEPAGSAVYLDGLKLSEETPSSVELIPAGYVLAVSKDGLVSFPHRFSLDQKRTSIHVDLKFEGALRSRPIPCISDAVEESAQLSSAVKLAAWLQLEQVILLRIDRNSAGPSWLAASLVEAASGQKLREGGLKLEDLSSAPDALEQLSDFIVSGTPGTKVFAVSGRFAPADTLTGDGKGGSAATGEDTDHSVSRTETPRRSWRKPLGFGLIGAGGLMLGAAVLLHVKSGQSWDELSSYYANGKAPSAQQLPSVRAIRSRAEDQRTTAIVFYVASGLAATGGAILILTEGRPSSARSPNVSLSAMPGTVLVSGAWP